MHYMYIFIVDILDYNFKIEHLCLLLIFRISKHSQYLSHGNYKSTFL